MLDFAWKDGVVTQVTVRSTLGGACRLRAPGAETLYAPRATEDRAQRGDPHV